MHAQPTYKQNKKQHYKQTFLVVLLQVWKAREIF